MSWPFGELVEFMAPEWNAAFRAWRAFDLEMVGAVYGIDRDILRLLPPRVVDRSKRRRLRASYGAWERERRARKRLERRLRLHRRRARRQRSRARYGLSPLVRLFPLIRHLTSAYPTPEAPR